MIDPSLIRAAHAAPYLTAEAERDLILRAQQGDRRARDRLVMSHMRLVLSEASRRKGYRVPPDDLVQEGTTGLLAAVDKFDTAQPVRFGTYALFWIRAAMNEAAIRGQSIVRCNTTSKAKSLFFGLRRARTALERTGDLSEGEVVDRLAADFDVSSDVIRSMSLHLAGGDTSMDSPLGSDPNAACLGDLIADDAELPDASAEEAIDSERNARLLADALGILNERERAIIAARRLAEDDAEQTLGELGDRFAISKERVRQIEVRALEKMRRFVTGQPARKARVSSRKRTGLAEAVLAARAVCSNAERETVASLSARLGISRARIYQIESRARQRQQVLAA